MNTTAAGHSPSSAPSSGRFVDWMQDERTAALGTRADDVSLDRVLQVVQRLQPIFGGPESYFPLQVEGLEQLPDAPVLLVSNHSGGTSIPDAWGLGVAWYRHFGRERPLHALAHDMVFALRSTAEPFAELGVLRAQRSVALAALRHWRRDVVVMPGGDLDTWRPWRERYQVRFSGRQGYARLAIRAGVPIVPVAHAGAHDTLMVLTDGKRLARALHFDSLFRAQVFPVHLSLPYGLAVGPFPHLPPPVTLRYRFGRPIHPPAQADPSVSPAAAAVQALDRQVRNALQHELHTLRQQMPPLHRRVGRRVAQLRRAARKRLPARRS